MATIIVALDKVMASVVPFPLTDALGRLEEIVIAYVDSLKKNDTSSLNLLGERLSNILIDPVKYRIAKKRHIIFVLSGILARIPISSLKYESQYLILQREVSQVPSLSALYYISRRNQNKTKGGRHGLSIISRPGTPKD